MVAQRLPSDWRSYTSSSKVIKEIVDAEGPWAFDYEVVQLHHNKLDLFYGELKDQMDADVLRAVDDDGHYIYYNEQIMGVEYRPKVPRAKLIAAREKAEKNLRDYMLKPLICNDCGEVIPYGQTNCAGKPMFGGGSCKE